MAMLAKKVQSAKAAAIEEAKKTFAEYNDFIFADYRGMTVEQISDLRKKLREQDAALKVVKNNFYKSVIRSKYRMTYDDVNKIFDYQRDKKSEKNGKNEKNENLSEEKKEIFFENYFFEKFQFLHQKIIILDR